MWMSCHRAEHEGTHMSAQSLSPLLLSPSPLSLSPVVAVLGAPCWCCRSVWAAAQQRQAPRLWPWCSSPADRHQLEGGTQGGTAAVRRTTAAWALASLDPSESRNIIARFSGCFLEEAQDSGGQRQRERWGENERREIVLTCGSYMTQHVPYDVRVSKTNLKTRYDQKWTILIVRWSKIPNFRVGWSKWNFVNSSMT